MRALLVVAAREIAERKGIFVVAAVASLLPLLAPLIETQKQAPEARGLYALACVVVMGAGTAFVLGATVLARDLSEHRIGFYFSRPVSSMSIWGGQILAAWLLSIGVSVVCLLPTFAVGTRVTLVHHEEIRQVLPLGLVALLFLVVLARTAMVALRSRSPWLVVDVVLLSLCSFVGARSVGRLAFAGILHPRYPSLIALEVGAVALLLVASAIQLAVGRTDPKRGHGAQSLVIWGVSLPLTLASMGLTAWLLSPTPGDLVRITEGQTAPRGDWVSVEGQARCRGEAVVSFLYDTRTGRSIALPLFFLAGWPTSFSSDGKMALVEMLSGEPDAPWRLSIADLEGAQPRLRPTGIRSPAMDSLCVSPSGKRVAFHSNDTLSVIDLSSEKTVTAIKLETPERFFFESEDKIRLFRSVVSASDKILTSVPLRELRVSEKRVLETGEVPRRLGTSLFLRYEADGRRLIALENDRTRSTLRDGRTGELLKVLSDGPKLWGFQPIAGGGLVTTEPRDGNLWLLRFDDEGHAVGTIDLGRFRRASLLGQVSRGDLLVAVDQGPNKTPAQGRHSTLLLVNLTTGTVTVRAKGLAPIPWGIFSPVMPPADTLGAPRTTLFLDSNGALVFLDVLTGERRQLLPKPNATIP